MLNPFFKKVVIFIFMLSLYFSWVFWFKNTPCEKPILYRIGTFDERFNITRQEFLNDIDKSTKIWESSINKNLFEYNPKGSLVINLKYDDRQEKTKENQILKTNVDKINSLAKEIKERYTKLHEEGIILKKDYEIMLANFDEKQKNYASKVEYWNSQNGAPTKEYSELMLEKQEIVILWNNLENKRLEINSKIEETNNFINKYNLLAETANVNIEKINESAGKEFEEGTYNPRTKEIDLYEFSSNKKLIRLLVHELGHALNLPHNENKESIMYSLNTANTLSLSKEDIESLKIECKINN